MDAEAFFGTLASTIGVGMSAAPLLQMRQILRYRASEEVSIPFLGILSCGAAAWVAFGIASSSVYLIVPNVLAVANTLATIVVAQRFREKPVPQKG